MAKLKKNVTRPLLQLPPVQRDDDSVPIFSFAFAEMAFFYEPELLPRTEDAKVGLSPGGSAEADEVSCQEKD